MKQPRRSREPVRGSPSRQAGQGGVEPSPAGGDTVPARLVKAAAAELSDNDGRMEMAAVARRAGLSVGLSYHYFGSKAGLLAAVVEDFYDRYDAAVIEPNPFPGGDWPTRERRRVERMVAFYLSDPLAPLILSRLSAEPQVAAVEVRRMARHIDLGALNVAGARQKGELPDGPDPHLLVAMMLGGLRQAVGQVFAGHLGRDAGALSRDLWGFVAAAAGLPVTRIQREETDAESAL